MKIFKDCDWNGITLIVTTKCNLRCSYCYEKGTAHEVLNFEDGVKIIDWFCSISKSKEQCITFFGGEPLTEVNLIKNLVEYCNEKHPNIVFSIATNGTLVNEDNIDLLRKFKFVNVSLDGSERVHNLHRRTPSDKNSFSMINFDLLHSLKNLTVTAVITPKNIYYLNESIKYINDNFTKDYRFKIAYEMDWKPEDILEFKKQWERLADNFVRDIDNPERWSLYRAVVSFLNFIKAFSENSHYSCNASSGCFTVSPSGELYPCQRFPLLRKYSFGNVFKEINLDKRTTLCNDEVTCEKCKKCTALALCPQRCYALRACLFNDGSEYNLKPHICELTKIKRDVCLSIYNRLSGHEGFNKVYQKSFSSLLLNH